MPVKLTAHRCGVCGRRLPDGKWIYSSHTGARYCLPTRKGCKPKRKEGHA